MTSCIETMTSLTFFQDKIILSRPGVSILADITKIAVKSKIKEYLNQEIKVKIITNY